MTPNCHVGFCRNNNQPTYAPTIPENFCIIESRDAVKVSSQLAMSLLMQQMQAMFPSLYAYCM